MKKGTSFYLEEDILDEIESYRVENGLKSKNTALERLVLEYMSLKKELEYTRVLVDYAKQSMFNNPNSKVNYKNTQNEKETSNENIKPSNSRIKRSIQNSYDSME